MVFNSSGGHKKLSTELSYNFPKLKLPDFGYMQPRRIKQECKKLEYKWKNLVNKETKLKSSEDEFRISLNKLVKNQILSKRDLKNLASYVDKIHQKGEKYFDRFIDYLKDKPEELMPTTLSLLIQNTYKCSHKYASNIFEIVRNVLVNLYLELTERVQEKYKEFTKLLLGKKSLDSFKQSIVKKIEAADSYEEIDKTRKKYYVEVDTQLFINGITDFINKNYKDEKFCRDFIKNMLIGKLSFDNLKHVFGIILRKMVDNNVKLPRFWLILIREKLGHPATPGNSRWNDIFNDETLNQKVKDEFRIQINTIELYDFFEKLSGDRDRLEFWKEYIPYMYRAEMIKNVDSNPFIMEFERHTFIEFGRTNNALFCYSKADINIEVVLNKVKANRYKDSKHYSSQVTDSLKNNRYRRDLRFSHSGNWQNRLRDKLADRGYGNRTIRSQVDTQPQSRKRKTRYQSYNSSQVYSGYSSNNSWRNNF